jgi:nicotinamidase-related amidase
MTFAYQSFPTIEPVLVCLDLQQEQQAAASPAERERRRSCVDACKQVLAGARGLHWKIAHVHYAQGRLGPLSAGSKPIPGLEPRPSEPIFYRQAPSAFSSGAFQEYLKLIAAPQLILVGFSLDGSALFTAMAAQEAAVPVTVVRGAVDVPPMGLLGSDVVESVLLGVVGGFTEILDTEELFDRATSSFVGQAANHP